MELAGIIYNFYVSALLHVSGCRSLWQRDYHTCPRLFATVEPGCVRMITCHYKVNAAWLPICKHAKTQKCHCKYGTPVNCQAHWLSFFVQPIVGYMWTFNRGHIQTTLNPRTQQLQAENVDIHVHVHVPAWEYILVWWHVYKTFLPRRGPGGACW